MVLGMGIDAVSLERMGSFPEGAIARFFHPSEVLQAEKLSGARKAEFLATRFAAKEALGKAMGTGLRSLRLKDIAVVSDALGKPSLILEGQAASTFEVLFPQARLLLSLTHEHPLALAQVMIVAGGAYGAQ